MRRKSLPPSQLKTRNQMRKILKTAMKETGKDPKKLAAHFKDHPDARGKLREAAIKKGLQGKPSSPAPPKQHKQYGKQVAAPKRKKYKGDKPLPRKDAAEAKKKSHYRY